MKCKIARFAALLLALVMVFACMPFSAFAADTNEFRVVVSVEGQTLGQGMYVEPKSYTLDEINALLSTEGYGPYAEDELTAGMATLAMFLDHGLEYEITGSWESDAYLSSITGIDKGFTKIPAIITENGGPSDEENDGNDDDALGEFDYSTMSGWMITVNDLLIPAGCAQFVLKENADTAGYENYGNTYVIRWHFSLWGFGADLGIDSDWGTSAYFTRANKDKLYTAYADSTDEAAKAAVLPVLEDLTATQAEVDAAEKTLTEKTEMSAQPKDVKAILNATMAQLAASIPEPAFGTTAGEWTVLALARGGYFEADSDYFASYYDRIVAEVQKLAAQVNQDGALHSRKYTENSRLIMALSAIGKDPTDVGGVDVVKPLNNYAKTIWQGVNGPAYALIALDSRNYQVEDTSIRQQYVDNILSRQLADGGWALSGSSADPDMTAMVLQALSNYREQAAVAAAAEKAFACLSKIQKDNGGYASWGTVNSESIAQVIVACTAWGVNPDTDSRFVKNGASVLDALLSFYLESEAKFCHTIDGAANAISTDQACYALVAYDRLISGQNPLYDMTDVKAQEPESKEIAATLSLPEKIENTAGTAFNAVISLNNWDAEADYKLADCIVSVPDGLTVTGVTAGSRIDGGQVSYHLEEETGKLRIVYFDAQAGNAITVGGTDFPAELFTIGFALKETVNPSAVSQLPVAVTGMSLKINSQSEEEAAMTIVDITKANGAVQVVKGLSFTAMTLYTGDGVDLIPQGRTAIAIAVTGVAEGAKITFRNGDSTIALRYSPSISQKTGVATYVCMADSTELAAFSNAANYTVENAAADTITFGDSNGDGLVNAQDALAAVDLWLRKADAPGDDDILTMNVNADARINTFDALGIVEHFVDGDEFAVVTKAATLKNAVD